MTIDAYQTARESKYVNAAINPDGTKKVASSNPYIRLALIFDNFKPPLAFR